LGKDLHRRARTKVGELSTTTFGGRGGVARAGGGGAELPADGEGKDGLVRQEQVRSGHGNEGLLNSTIKSWVRKSSRNQWTHFLLSERDKNKTGYRRGLHGGEGGWGRKDSHESEPKIDLAERLGGGC